MTVDEHRDAIVAVVMDLGASAPLAHDGWVPMPLVRAHAPGPRLSPYTWRSEIRALVAQGRLERLDDGSAPWEPWRQVWVRVTNG